MQILEKLAFHPPKHIYDGDINYLEFIIKSDQHRLPIRFYHENYKYTMIMCHGNAEDISQSNPYQISKQFKVNICLFDYAGYGLHSEPTSSIESCQSDILAVYHHLITYKNIRPHNIIIYGRSLGTYLACYLSNKIQQSKLVLISPMMSAIKLITNIWSPIDILTNYELAPNISCSTLIIHGDSDKIVSYVCGYELSKLFPNLYDFVLLSDIGHDDIIFDPLYTRSIYNFIHN